MAVPSKAELEREAAERREKSYQQIEEMGVSNGPSRRQLEQLNRDLDRIERRIAERKGKR